MSTPTQGAVGSWREGIGKTLTLTDLGIHGALKRARIDEPCELMIEIVGRTSRNLKRWSSGEMSLR